MISHNLKRLLGMHDLAQRDLAQFLGVSLATTSSWMNDHTEPGLANSLKLASLFCTSVEDLNGPFLGLIDIDRYLDTEDKIMALKRPGGTS